MKTSELALPEGVEILASDTPEKSAEALAEAVSAELRQRLSRADRVSLVVSGGSTPVPFFDALSRAELDWPRVTVLLADERWVPESDPASNTALVKARLLQNRAAAAQWLPLFVPEAEPRQGVSQIELRLAELELPLDVLILGLGSDGHTASLFPDAPELMQGLAPKDGQRVAIMTPPSQAQTRVTLTLPVLMSARFTALHVRGEEKLRTLARATVDPGNWEAMPIRALLRPGLNIYWSR